MRPSSHALLRLSHIYTSSWNYHMHCTTGSSILCAWMDACVDAKLIAWLRGYYCGASNSDGGSEQFHDICVNILLHKAAALAVRNSYFKGDLCIFPSIPVVLMVLVEVDV